LAAKATEVRDSDAKTTRTTQRNHVRMMYSLKTRNLRAADWNENRPGPPAVYQAAIKCALLRGIKCDGDHLANRKEPFVIVTGGASNRRE
jgi:hypothetical protein